MIFCSMESIDQELLFIYSNIFLFGSVFSDHTADDGASLERISETGFLKLHKLRGNSKGFVRAGEVLSRCHITSNEQGFYLNENWNL